MIKKNLVTALQVFSFGILSGLAVMSIKQYMPEILEKDLIVEKREIVNYEANPIEVNEPFDNHVIDGIYMSKYLELRK